MIINANQGIKHLYACYHTLMHFYHFMKIYVIISKYFNLGLIMMN